MGSTPIINQESAKQIETMLKHQDEQKRELKAEVFSDTQKAVKEIIDGKFAEMTMILEKNPAEGNKGPEEVLALRSTNAMLITRLYNIEKQNNERESKDATSNKNFADLIKTMSDKADIREAGRTEDATKRDAEATKNRQDQEAINSKMMARLHSFGTTFKELEASISKADAESPSKRGKCDA